MIWQTLIFSGVVLLFGLGFTYLGHWITMRSIAHVQPSTTDMARQIQEGGATEPEPDYITEAMFNFEGDEKPDGEDISKSEDMVSKLKEMNLNTEDIEADLVGAQMKPVVAATASFVNTTGMPEEGAVDEA
jgi:hypothetical protein